MISIRSFAFVGVFAAIVMSAISTLLISWKWHWIGVTAFCIATLFSLDKKMVSNFINEKNRALNLLGLGLLVVFFSCLAVSFIIIGDEGVCVTENGPIFSLRDRYLLSNHGVETEVSRARYLLEGVSSVLGWHSLILLAVIQLVVRPNQSMKMDVTQGGAHSK